MLKKIGMAIIICATAMACNKTTVEPLKKTRFSGDHTTAQIRGLWYVCLQTRQRSMPYIAPQIHGVHCDCVTDKSREQFSSTQYEKIPQDNMSAAFTDINIECSMIKNIKLKKINPAAI